MTQYAPSSLRQFTVDEYFRLIEIGMIAEGEPIELLDGMLVKKMSKNPPHDLVLMFLFNHLLRQLPIDWEPRIQSAFQTRNSVPEPDIAIVRGPAQRYAQRHPNSSDAGLVVEVSDSSLDRDQGIKLAIYADAGIVEYWIVNIPDNRLEVYTQPTGTGLAATYTRVQNLGPTDRVTLTLGGVALPTILVRDILP